MPYTIISGFLYKLGQDDILRRCALNHEKYTIIDKAHLGPTRGHFQVNTIV